MTAQAAFLALTLLLIGHWVEPIATAGHGQGGSGGNNNHHGGGQLGGGGGHFGPHNPFGPHGPWGPQVPSDPNAPPAQIGQLSYAGSGCPEGSLGAVLSPDQTALAILFDRFVAEAGGTTGQGAARLDCTFVLPITLPDGYALSVVAMDFRGFTSLPNGAKAALSSTHRFRHKMKGSPWNGKRGDVMTGPFEDSFFFTQNLPTKWDSACGGVVEFNVNVALELAGEKKQPITESSLVSLDTIDTVTAPITYGIQLRKCK